MMGPMMMGGGVLIILFALLLIVALVAGGRLTSRSRSLDEENRPTASLAATLTARPGPACGRTVQLNWNVCPYCGNELT